MEKSLYYTTSIKDIFLKFGGLWSTCDTRTSKTCISNLKWIKRKYVIMYEMFVLSISNAMLMVKISLYDQTMAYFISKKNTFYPREIYIEMTGPSPAFIAELELTFLSNTLSFLYFSKWKNNHNHSNKHFWHFLGLNYCKKKKKHFSMTEGYFVKTCFSLERNP